MVYDVSNSGASQQLEDLPSRYDRSDETMTARKSAVLCEEDILRCV